MRCLLFSSFASLCLLACGGTATTGGNGGAGTSSSSSSSSGTTTSSSSSTGSSSSSSGTSSSSSGASSSSSSSSSSSGVCLDCVNQGFTCCGGKCVNTKNDIGNCGACSTGCLGPEPYCDNGICGKPPCMGQTCPSMASECCGAECCGAGQLCCAVQTAGPFMGPKCYDAAASGGTCPVGCPLCK